MYIEHHIEAGEYLDRYGQVQGTIKYKDKIILDTAEGYRPTKLWNLAGLISRVEQVLGEQSPQEHSLHMQSLAMWFQAITKDEETT